MIYSIYPKPVGNLAWYYDGRFIKSIKGFPVFIQRKLGFKMTPRVEIHYTDWDPKWQTYTLNLLRWYKGKELFKCAIRAQSYVIDTPGMDDLVILSPSEFEKIFRYEKNIRVKQC